MQLELLGRKQWQTRDELANAVFKWIERVLISNQRHLHLVLANYVRHDNGRRHHRARELRPPQPTYPAADLSYERIKGHPILGGLINEYERAA
jgi:putative transposase